MLSESSTILYVENVSIGTVLAIIDKFGIHSIDSTYYPQIPADMPTVPVLSAADALRLAYQFEDLAFTPNAELATDRVFVLCADLRPVCVLEARHPEARGA